MYLYMLNENDNWTKKINNLIYINRGLSPKELKYINTTLNTSGLRFFVNLRYAPDPIRYDKMKKCELINELKYTRYDN